MKLLQQQHNINDEYSGLPTSIKSFLYTSSTTIDFIIQIGNRTLARTHHVAE